MGLDAIPEAMLLLILIVGYIIGKGIDEDDYILSIMILAACFIAINICYKTQDIEPIHWFGLQVFVTIYVAFQTLFLLLMSCISRIDVTTNKENCKKWANYGESHLYFINILFTFSLILQFIYARVTYNISYLYLAALITLSILVQIGMRHELSNAAIHKISTFKE